MNDLLHFAEDVRVLKNAILRSRYMAARLANAEMLKLYFAVGWYVSCRVRSGKWGEGTIVSISEMLQKELPGLRGFSESNIKMMRQFFEAWGSDLIGQPVVVELQKIGVEEIGQPLVAQLGPTDSAAFQSIGFSHHLVILNGCKTVESRLYYIRKCATEFWSRRVLMQHIKAHEFETQGHALNNFEMAMPDDAQIGRAVQAFRSEYLLDFVNIVDANETEQERDEPVWMMDMVAKIRHFIQALGSDFCFMDVKKRFVVGEKEYFADLLFYHRSLGCMVAIELKKGEFKPEYLGQLDFYLACLDKFVKHPTEQPSIGLLLCHEMDKDVVELAIRRHNSPIGVATYRTSADVPDEYKVFAPILEGAQALLTEPQEGQAQ